MKCPILLFLFGPPEYNDRGIIYKDYTEISCINNGQDIPSIYAHPPGISCWQPGNCPPGELLKAWMAPELRPLLREHFEPEMAISLAWVSPLGEGSDAAGGGPGDGAEE